MKRHFVKPSVAGVVGVVGLVVLAGCSSKDTSGVDDDSIIQANQNALDADNGGYTTADTAPYFGDATVQALPGFSAVDADTTDLTADAIAAPGATAYHIALLWGHLPPAHDAVATDVDPAVIDWSGSVSVDAGAIGLKKTLMFDRLDHVDPRTDPKTISFDSHTLPFVDGLYLSVVIPAGASATLHFATNALTTDIDLGQFVNKEGDVTRLPDGHNGLAYIGYTDVPGCARGLMFGRWLKEDANIGIFRGTVEDGSGEAIGHVKGIWGHASRKNKDLFFGKYISTTGRHEGLFGGQYADGHYDGDWGTLDPANVGHLEGIYSDGYDRADGRGVFVGRWSELCK